MYDKRRAFYSIDCYYVKQLNGYYPCNVESGGYYDAFGHFNTTTKDSLPLNSNRPYSTFSPTYDTKYGIAIDIYFTNDIYTLNLVNGINKKIGVLNGTNLKVTGAGGFLNFNV